MDIRAEAMPGLYNGGLHIDSDSLGIYNVWSGLHVLGLNAPELHPGYEVCHSGGLQTSFDCLGIFNGLQNLHA